MTVERYGVCRATDPWPCSVENVKCGATMDHWLAAPNASALLLRHPPIQSTDFEPALGIGGQTLCYD